MDGPITMYVCDSLTALMWVLTFVAIVFALVMGLYVLWCVVTDEWDYRRNRR